MRQLFSVNNQAGGGLLMVMVILGMLAVMFISLVGVISRESVSTSDASQRERIYQITESGIQRVLFLVGKAGFTIDSLAARYPSASPEAVPVFDPVTSDLVGSYTLSVNELPSGEAATVVATGKSPDNRFCSQVTARIERPSGAPAGQYVVGGWSRSNCP